MKPNVAVREKFEARWQELYQQLNPEQRQAVAAIEGPVMVLAGPGTGKTQVLAMRIANILQQTQMDPWNILCLTFTESAAATMRERLISIMGEAAYYVRIHTFHAFCNDVIQENPEVFALAGEWQPLSDVERVELVQSLLDELPGTSPLKPFGNTYMFLRDIVQALSWLKKEGVSPERLAVLLKESAAFLAGTHTVLEPFLALKAAARDTAACEAVVMGLEKARDEVRLSVALWAPVAGAVDRYQTAGKQGKREAGKARTGLKDDLKRYVERAARHLPRQKHLLKVYSRYQEALLKRGRYDFEDMVLQVVEKFGEDDQLLARYQEQFQYVLVDEYQDTNGAQNEVVRLLGSFDGKPNVFVVGDDKQSIFRFQGASLENLLLFYERYGTDTQVVSLKNNYRSRQVILDAAEAVIAHNTESMQKYVPAVNRELVAVAPDSNEPLELREFETEDEENFFVAQKIQELIAGGADPSAIAVLYRFNRDVDSLLDVLLRMDIPVKLEAGENVLAERRVQQLLALLAYVTTPAREAELVWADAALADILQFDFCGLDPLAVLQVVHFAGTTRRSLVIVLASPELLQEAGVEKSAPFVDLMRKLAQWRKEAANFTAQHVFDVVLQESGLLRHVLGNGEHVRVVHHLNSVFSELKRLNSGEGALTMADFVRRLALLDQHGLQLVADPWQTRAKAARLMTAHKAKGLEFAHVFIIRAHDRHWGGVPERTRIALPAGIVKHEPVQGAAGNEDERRLFYVALTRAKQQVYVSYARLGDQRRERVASLFVREIPGALVAEFDTTETEDAALQRLQTLRLKTVPVGLAIDGRAWLAERLIRYRMSVTHLNNYLECPRLFYYRNLLRVPAAKTKHMAFGTAVHNALRDLFMALNDTGALPPQEELLGRLLYHLDREVLTDQERADCAALGREALGAYYDHYQRDFAQRSLSEYSFRQHGVHVDNLPLTGQLDKIEFLSDTRVNVVDYKTGNPDNAYSHAKPGGKYHRQLVFYKLLCDASPRFPHEMASGEIDFVQKSRRSGTFVKRRYEISVDEVAELKDTIRRVWGEIQALKFLDGDAACGVCEYCQLRKILNALS